MKCLVAILTLFFTTLSIVDGKVSRIVIDERILLADGYKFGDVGPYEKLRGKIYYEMDPASQANARIVDLQLAPRNKHGMVECYGDFILLKPVDMDMANGRLLYDVNNRGNLYMLRHMNGSPGSNNPQSLEHCGNGFLMREGTSRIIRYAHCRVNVF